MTYKEIYEKVMPEKKRKEERFNIFGHWIGRPVSVWMTMPLVETKIKPTTVTIISMLSSLIGFFLVAFGKSMPLKLVGWFFFFFWSLLDGVDGNLARCTDQCSSLGDLWDTTAGYAAMVQIYFSTGIAAFYDLNAVAFLKPHWLLMIGGATAIASIFPRLVMHKKKSSNTAAESVKALSDKEHFKLKNIIAMNILSPSGFMQVIFLVCILTHTLNFFICFYAVVNFGMMAISLYKLLRR